MLAKTLALQCKRSSIVVLALLVTVLSGCASNPQAGARDNWDRLGARDVNWRLDRDTIVVTAAEGRFSKLQFRVAKAPIEIIKCTVFFGDGSKHNVTLRDRFNPGTASRVIDLPGDRRVIRKVEFTYGKAKRGSQTPKVVLYGGRL